MHCRKTFLYHNQEPWVKKENRDFDVGMGSLHSAGVCQLGGLFLLKRLRIQFPSKMTDSTVTTDSQSQAYLVCGFKVYAEQGVSIRNKCYVGENTPFLYRYFEVMVQKIS